MKLQESRWEAVLARDARADGAFVYAVKSTGVYCRPSCPSRRPGRAQVEFFAAPAHAERAGFRPCRRCHPDGRSPSAAMADRLRRHIEDRLDEPVTLAALAAEAGTSPHRVHRMFRGATGLTPRQYADALRVGKVKAGLRDGGSVAAATYDAGYGSSSRLYERAAASFGMTPATYARGGAGVSIRFTVTPCALGRLLVAATEAGICAVRLGDSAAALEADLRREFPQARIRPDDPGLQPWVQAIVDQIHGAPAVSLPLDVRATAFQRRVWEALRAIPRGQTRSYSDVARGLGRPSATRAVANACAANPVAVVVPCHRVIREDGALGGYRWGLARKQALLKGEGSPASSRPGMG